MKVWHLILVLIFCWHTSLAQDTKEAFLNSVFRVCIDSGAKYYYLSLEAHPVVFSASARSKTEYQSFLPDDVALQFDRSAKDTIVQHWDHNKLTAATLITLKQFQVKQRGKVIAKLPREEQYRYSFSKPVFSHDGSWAMIRCSRRCTLPFCSHGCNYIFRKVSGKWVRVGEVLCISS